MCEFPRRTSSQTLRDWGDTIETVLHRILQRLSLIGLYANVAVPQILVEFDRVLRPRCLSR